MPLSLPEKKEKYNRGQYQSANNVINETGFLVKALIYPLIAVLYHLIYKWERSIPRFYLIEMFQRFAVSRFIKKIKSFFVLERNMAHPGFHTGKIKVFVYDRAGDDEVHT